MRCLVRSVVVAGVVAAGVGSAGAATVAAATVGEPAPNPVHVAVDADVPEPKSGDVVTYTVRVRNDSPAGFPHMDVFQLLPSGFRVTESTPKAAATKTGPEWTADVPAGGTVVLTATATAGTVAEAEHTRATAARQRSAASATATGPASTTFTTTACARDVAVGPALACGSAKQTLSDSPDGTGAPAKWQPGLLGLGFAVALAVGFRGYVRKRRGRRAAARAA